MKITFKYIIRYSIITIPIYFVLLISDISVYSPLLIISVILSLFFILDTIEEKEVLKHPLMRNKNQ